MPQNKSEEYKAKYGNSVMLSNESVEPREGESVVMYEQYTRLKNGQLKRRNMCACLDCQKTYAPRKDDKMPWCQYTSCPDCGGKEYSYSFNDKNKVTVGRATNNVNYIMRPRSKAVFGNYDETATASRLNTVYKGDLFIVYPSNKMHAAQFEADMSVNLVDNEIRYTCINTENPEDLKIVNSFQIKDSLGAGYSMSPNDVWMSALLSKATEQEHEDNISCSITHQPGVLQDVYDSDTVKLAYSELAKRYGIAPIKQTEDTSDFYYRSSNVVKNEQKMLDMCVRYPGVREMVLDRVNENLSYKKEPHTQAEDAIVRRDALLDMADNLMAIDKNMNEDLRRLKTKDEVGYYLKSITYGKDAVKDEANPIPSFVAKSLHIKPEKSNHDGFGDKKKLKKRFNANPILTSNTVYTVTKMSPLFLKNIDYANQFFDCIDKHKELVKGSPLDTAEYSPNLICKGTLRPLETRDEIRFMKKYIESHVDKNTGKGLSQVITDWYGNTDRNANKAGMFHDSAEMYCNLAAKGPIALTRADCLKYSVIDAKRKINDMITEDHMSQDEIVETLSDERYWGHSASACVGLVMNDLKKNGPPLDSEIGFVGQNGKSMMQNRTPAEIHDEFVKKTTSLGKDNIVNVSYEYSKEQKERFNRDIDDVHFRLAKDTYDLIRTGEQMHICVGGAGYDNQVQRGSCIICIVENKAREKVGCIELSPSGDSVRQFKSPHNGSMQEPYVDTCRQWMDECKIQDQNCVDVMHFGDSAYFPYGNGDFTARRLAANPYPDKNNILDYYREQEKAEEILKSAERQLNGIDDTQMQ